jgi:hypothetical protein
MRDKRTTEFRVNRTDIAVQELEGLKQLDLLVRESMNLDFPDRLIDSKEYSQEDKKFLNKMSQSMQLVDGHYQVGLPLRTNKPLPNNIEQAKQRLISLAKRMNHNQEIREEYRMNMSSLISKNYAEQVPAAELQGPPGKVWYIPHHCVRHPKKPNKMRIVFDCAASFQGIALNDVLLQGPNLTNNLIGVLLRFRQGRNAITSDIEAMFHQVGVPKEDRDLFRFLWWPNDNIEEEPVAYRMCVHLFGATSSPSCANSALHKTVEDNKDHFRKEVCDTVLKNFYVDDCLKPIDDENEAIILIQSLRQLCAKGGFVLTKWTSNNKNILDTIPPNERNSQVTQLNLDYGTSTSRVLGIQWSPECDKFGFAVDIPDRPCTRKGLLSVVNSVYDLLGMVAPFILPAKLLLQDLCRRQVPWNDEITGVDLKRWRQWLMELPRLNEFKTPRC